MYSNRLMYKSLQASDSSFFSQVLFCIDRALQIHWKSCCECSERESVNNRVLFMSDKRDLIIQHNFTYNIPKMLRDKLFQSKKSEQDLKNENGKAYKHLEDKIKDKDRDKKNQFKSWKDIITDNDLKHAEWRLQDGEDFSKRFYLNQKKCPKTKDGKLICMKLSSAVSVISRVPELISSRLKMKRPLITSWAAVLKEAQESRIFRSGQC